MRVVDGEERRKGTAALGSLIVAKQELVRRSSSRQGRDRKGENEGWLLMLTLEAARRKQKLRHLPRRRREKKKKKNKFAYIEESISEFSALRAHTHPRRLLHRQKLTSTAVLPPPSHLLQSPFHCSSSSPPPSQRVSRRHLSPLSRYSVARPLFCRPYYSCSSPPSRSSIAQPLFCRALALLCSSSAALWLVCPSCSLNLTSVLYALEDFTAKSRRSPPSTAEAIEAAASFLPDLLTASPPRLAQSSFLFCCVRRSSSSSALRVNTDTYSAVVAAKMEPEVVEAELVLPSYLSFKKVQMYEKYPKGQSRGRHWKHLKQIIQAENYQNYPPEEPNYVNIESPPSMHPCKKICDITGFEAPYYDPRTNLRYANTEVFKIIRSLPNEYVQRYLALRNAQVVLK